MSNQTTSTVNFDVGTASTFAIQQFTSTTLCDTDTPVFSYKGFKMVSTTLVPLDAPTDFIQVDAATGNINILSTSIAGTYNIRIEGSL